MPYYLTPKQEDYNQIPRPLITNDRFWPKADVREYHGCETLS